MTTTKYQAWEEEMEARELEENGVSLLTVIFSGILGMLLLGVLLLKTGLVGLFKSKSPRKESDTWGAGDWGMEAY